MQGDGSDSDLFLEVDGVGLGLVLSHGELLEGRLQLPRRVRQDGVREVDPWAAHLGPVGPHDPRYLLGERVPASGPWPPPSVATSWSRVAPPEPAARRLSATWRESGEKATLLAEPAGEGVESAAARRSAKRVWCPMETRMSAVAMVGVGRSTWA